MANGLPNKGSLDVQTPATPIYLNVVFPLTPAAPKIIHVTVLSGPTVVTQSETSISNYPLGNGAALKGQSLRVVTTMNDPNSQPSQNEVDYHISGPNNFDATSNQTDPGPLTAFDFMINFK